MEGYTQRNNIQSNKIYTQSSFRKDNTHGHPICSHLTVFVFTVCLLTHKTESAEYGYTLGMTKHPRYSYLTFLCMAPGPDLYVFCLFIFMPSHPTFISLCRGEKERVKVHDLYTERTLIFSSLSIPPLNPPLLGYVCVLFPHC